MSEIIKNTVMDAIIARRSTRAYTAEKLTDAEIATIVEAGLWAPTAMNKQEIDFIIINDSEARKAFVEGFSGPDAVKDGKLRDFGYGSPTFILVYGPAAFPFTGIDGGIAVQTMALAAESLGLGSVIVGCVKDYLASEPGKAFAKSLGVRDGYVFSIGLAVGHIAKPTEPKPRNEGRVIII